MTGIAIEGELHDALRSGVMLCTLANTLRAGTIPKVSESALPFPQRENITAFIDAARGFGVLDRDNFDTNDLYEHTNMKQVLICLAALGRLSEQIEGFDGPHLPVGVESRVAQQGGGGKVRTLSVGLADKIALGPPPPAAGSFEWLELQQPEGGLKSDDAAVSRSAAESAQSPTPSHIDAHPTKVRVRVSGRRASTRRRKNGACQLLASLTAIYCPLPFARC
eukprot:SAG11_NODE_4126_length_2049_cov_1.605735_2_plen_222_part_00